MTKIRSAVESFLGICVLVIALTFVGFILKEGGFKTKELSYFKADFDSVDGLSKGSLVKINGVVVGHVCDIELDKDSAIVSFGIDKKISLPKDTLAAIISESLLGGKFLNLVLGNEEALLSENSTIYQTESAVSLEQLLQKFLFNSSEDKSAKDKENKEENKEEAMDNESKEESKSDLNKDEAAPETGSASEAKSGSEERSDVRIEQDAQEKKAADKEFFLEGFTPSKKSKVPVEKDASLDAPDSNATPNTTQKSSFDAQTYIQDSVYQEFKEQLLDHLLKAKTLIS